MSFALVSNWDMAYREVGELTAPNRAAYAETRGYDYVRSSYAGHWGKVEALLAAWDSAEWLWWLDADAVVTNQYYHLEQIVDLVVPQTQVIVTCDVMGLNSGSMMFRTTPRARACLERMRAYCACYGDKPLFDQVAFAHQLWTIADFVKVVPQRVMNSYPDYGRNVPAELWQPGDFVFHCPGLTTAARLRLLAEKLKGLDVP